MFEAATFLRQQVMLGNTARRNANLFLEAYNSALAESCRKKIEEEAVTAVEPEPDEELVSLKKEAEELRRKCRSLKEEVKTLYAENKQLKKQEAPDDPQVVLPEEPAEPQKEPEEEPFTTEEMSEFLQDARICVLGGHDQIVKRLQERFPSWTFVDATVALAQNETMVRNYQMVLCLSNRISHPAYYKFKNSCKTHDIQFIETKINNMDLLTEYAFNALFA